MKAARFVLWMLIGTLLFGFAARAQAVYQAGRSGGGYALVAGDHVRFTPGSNPIPDFLYLYVESGEGNVIVSDGVGDVSTGLYFSTGDLILLGTPGPFDLYFQGGAIQIVYGGAQVGALPAPVCGTGVQGPVILLPDKKYSAAVQSSSETSIKVGVYATLQSFYSGSLPYLLASDYTRTGSYAVPTCTGSECCNPTSLVFTVNNITGSSFEVVQLDADPAADFDYALSQPVPLAAAAHASPTNGAPPLTVDFQGKASGGSPPYNYTWDFGDGSAKKTSQNPSHTYDTAGTFNPVLKVTDSDGGVAKDESLSIDVNTPITVTANVTPSSGDIPLTVTCTASASGGTPPYTYDWDFGEGGQGSGASTTHIYTKAGAYSVSLSVEDSVGVVNQEFGVVVRAIDPNALYASAQADVTAGSVPLTVHFTGSASGGAPPYTYAWNFGDGGQSTEQNPTHTYTTVGTYHPVFTATDSTSAYTTDNLTVQANPGESVPVIFQVKKKGSPFRLKILGSGFAPGCQVLIDGVTVPMVSYKTANKVVAKNGRALKDMVPKGTAVCVTVRNPQGSESPCFSFTR